MSQFSFGEIGAVTATFAVDSGVRGGQVVKVNGNGKVGACTAGDKFCGVAMEPRKGGGAVQVRGFMTVSYTGTLSVGQVVLAADGQGGVKAASSGVSALVVSVGTDGTAVICL
jgi:hypothetical protein